MCFGLVLQRSQPFLFQIFSSVLWISFFLLFYPLFFFFFFFKQYHHHITTATTTTIIIIIIFNASVVRTKSYLSPVSGLLVLSEEEEEESSHSSVLVLLFANLEENVRRTSCDAYCGKCEWTKSVDGSESSCLAVRVTSGCFISLPRLIWT